MLDLAAGERADHEFGDAERQGPHGRGSDGGPRGAAQTENAVDFALPVQLKNQLGRPSYRRLHRLAAIAGFPNDVERSFRGGKDLLAADVRREGRCLRSSVDYERLEAAALQ